MEFRAIIHSFHSYVSDTLAELDESPDLILSLDSHVDAQLFGQVESMPKEIRKVALRASAHTMILRTFGELPAFIDEKDEYSILSPKMYLAIPSVGWETELQTKYLKINPTLEDKDKFRNERELKKWYSNLLKKLYRIKIYESPPNNLLKLVKKIQKADYPILDIDVDYIGTMQSECYTPLKGVKIKDLGNVDKVISLIRKSKPPIITISEAKLSAINDVDSNFSKMIDRISNLGYEVELSTVLDSDEEAMRLLSMHENYFKEVQEPFWEKHAKERLSEDYSYSKELSKETKKYFRTVTSTQTGHGEG